MFEAVPHFWNSLFLFPFSLKQRDKITGSTLLSAFEAPSGRQKKFLIWR